MPSLSAATPRYPGAIEPAAAQVMNCPGCGRRVTLADDESADVSCARCTTPLMTYARRLDVENSVRERLYGRRAGVSPRRRRREI